MGLLISKMTIHPAWKAQIALPLGEEAIVSAEYADFAIVFSKKLANLLPKRIDINEHTMELVDGKQPSYKPIYSLD